MQSFAVNDWLMKSLPETIKPVDLFNELQEYFDQPLGSLSFDTRKGIFQIKELDSTEFDSYQSQLQSSKFSVNDVLKLESYFSFKGNEYIYGLKEVGLCESPGVCIAVFGTEVALLEEALPLKNPKKIELQIWTENTKSTGDWFQKSWKFKAQGCLLLLTMLRHQ